MPAKRTRCAQSRASDIVDPPWGYRSGPTPLGCSDNIKMLIVILII